MRKETKLITFELDLKTRLGKPGSTYKYDERKKMIGKAVPGDKFRVEQYESRYRKNKGEPPLNTAILKAVGYPVPYSTIETPEGSGIVKDSSEADKKKNNRWGYVEMKVEKWI